jgi:hypothetical protein
MDNQINESPLAGTSGLKSNNYAHQQVESSEPVAESQANSDGKLGQIEKNPEVEQPAGDELGGDGARPSIKFLQDFFGDQLWQLVALKKGDRRSPWAATYESAYPRAALAWIENRNNDGWDIYFAINPIRFKNNRAKQKDITAAAWLHVDFDPPADIKNDPVKLADWRRRPPPWPNLPKPTLIIDSGRGFWFYWKLHTPIVINGEVSKIQLFKDYFRGIEAAFKSAGVIIDGACGEISRIGRLPGTINHKTGTIARVIQWRNLTYSLEDFPRANVTPLRIRGDNGGPTIHDEDLEKRFEGCSAEEIDAIILDEAVSALNAIDSGVSYPDWFKISAAFFDATKGKGFREWDAWCRKCPKKYDASMQMFYYRSFSKPGGIKKGTLFRQALDRGWDYGRELDKWAMEHSLRGASEILHLDDVVANYLSYHRDGGVDE